MRVVQTEEWRRFIPGIRMYKGKMTYFYNGEILWDVLNGDHLIYNWEERQSWEVIIILPGVEVIPEDTFNECENVKTVIMADTVNRIEELAFDLCESLVFIGLSRNLKYIGDYAFQNCSSLPTIFIPPSCREVWTALIKKSPIDTDQNNQYDSAYEEEVVRWVKSINNEEEYALHWACTSFNPLSENSKAKRYQSHENAIGITPSQYLAANPFADISEKEIVNRYILDMMGEVF
ncbi:hypothetical protein CTEN210_18444 [Chaetoceros tenuissimus]|uniref:Leucine-rich repeat domain-containing protein n=1 Tax=Chaetoceros tenuissimus TaxID=426638 RepID=A0AAD3HGB1_9STRA|nr:hypothetical protein CTEN210_18444 [Chaetoceros tenuissimus]